MSVPNTEVLVLKIRKHWRGQQATTDRRHHRRFDNAAVAVRVALVERAGDGLRLRDCELVNVSYGGMCLGTDLPLDRDAEARFLIDLGAPFCDVVLVKARVLWIDGEGEGPRQVGVQFLESSKGWLGPDEDEHE